MGSPARPAAEEVIAKLKDDGDFDILRLSIIRKVKENEELRNSIIHEVKRSAILNADGSEDMKPRQLSDGIYQEIGSKIMGQISDEVWKVIKSDDSKNQIREAVESVYNQLINPKGRNEDCSSPYKQQPASSNNADASPVYPKGKNSSPYNQHLANCNSANASPAAASTTEVNTSDGMELMAPPGFAPSVQHTSSSNEEENKEMLLDQRPSSSSREVNHPPPDEYQPSYDELPPGFAPQHHVPEQPVGGSDEDPDVPPGFG